MRRARAATMVAIFWAASVQALAGVAEAWQAVTELDRGPATEFRSREAAREATLSHLGRQEAALRRFLDLYPASEKTVDARLRLARLYLVRGDLSENPKLVEKAFVFLAELRDDPRLPLERKPDVAFADLSLRMQKAQGNARRDRGDLVSRAGAFRRDFPDDRRIAALFATLAGAFEDDPAEQKRLLEIAAPVAKDEALKLQIADDLRRIAMLGKTVAVEFESVDGRKIDLADYRGKVVALCFFADLSAPSLIALAKVEELSRNFPAHSLQCLGVSLDSSATRAKETLQRFEIDWPVLCDGRGWETPLVRRLGINTLPTVWIFDRRGRLRLLNASEDPVRAVKALIRER